MKKLLCLHGFLGSPNDFDFLKDDYEITAPDLSEYVGLEFDKLNQEFNKQFDIKNYIVLGYSFGARLGLQLLAKNKEIKKLICLAGHLGLGDKERSDRKVFEDQIIEKLNNDSEDKFLNYWNDFNLFSHDTALVKANFQNAALYFQNYGLSKQPYLGDLLQGRSENISFHYGKLDKKYSDYAKKYLESFNVKYYENIGHRFLQHPELVKKILRLELCN